MSYYWLVKLGEQYTWSLDEISLNEGKRNVYAMKEGETPHPRHAMKPCAKTVGITSIICVVTLGKFSPS